MNPKLEETIYVDFITSSPTTGAAVDADSTPTCEVFEETNDTGIITPTVVKRTAKSGNYRVPIACTAANGFEAAKSYSVVISATVGTIAAKAVVANFQMRTRSIDDVSTISAADVWAAATRTLTAISDSAGITTLLTRIASTLTITSGKVDVNDKTGFALTADYDPAKTALQTGGDVNVTSINGATVNGSGTSGDLWRG